MTTADGVLEVLASVTGREEIKDHLDVRLYDQHLLDSLNTVELIVSFSDRFGVEISPAELEPEQWATPRKIIADMESRICR